MRRFRKLDAVDRRRFLGGSASAVALAAAGMVPDADAIAATLKALKVPAAATLVKMARDLYPHDRLSDIYYQNAVAKIAGDLAKDPATKDLLKAGVAALNAAAVKLHGKPYDKLTAEADRVSVLKAIEKTPFFGAVRSGMITALYNQPAVWTKLGYEGASAEKGGYLHRGFDDLDWLPA